MGKILLQSFNQGGIADSKYSGVKNSWARLIGWDLHSKPGLLQVNQKMTKDSGVVITEFCKNKVDCSNGIRYWFSSDSGKIWQEKAGVYTLVHTTVLDYGSVVCLGAIEYDGYIYWITQNSVLRIPVTKADGASNWTSYAEYSVRGSMDIASYTNLNSVSEYTLLTSISEAAANKQAFTPTVPSLKGIGVASDTLGTGDFTVTVHDSANNSIASVTVANASMASILVGDPIDRYFFQFSSPVTLDLAQTYHVHITISTGTSKVLCATAADFSTAELQFLTTCDDTYHPLKVVNDVLYIGDKNFIHYVDNSIGNSMNSIVYLNALNLETRYRVSALGKMGTDLLVGTIIASSITECEIFRWNTYSDSFTSSDTVKEPGINCFLEADNYVLVSAGLQGNLYSYNGSQLLFYKKIPGTYSPTAQCMIYPSATDMFNGYLPIFGVSNYTGNPCDEGVWSLGRFNPNYPTVLNLEFPSSQVDSDGYNILSGIEIGSLVVSGQNVYMAWRRKVTATMTIANPGVVTISTHGLANGDSVIFTTTGALPTGVVSGTTYYARAVDANTFNLYDTAAHAISGGSTGRVTTSGSQSGTHTATLVGVDKLDYSNKIVHPIAESRVIVPQLGGFETFNKYIATYETLPASTSIVFKTSQNAAAYVPLSPAAIDDSLRAMVIGDASRLETRTLQLRMEAVSSANTSPSIQEVIIDVS